MMRHVFTGKASKPLADDERLAMPVSLTPNPSPKGEGSFVRRFAAFTLTE